MMRFLRNILLCALLASLFTGCAVQQVVAKYDKLKEQERLRYNNELREINERTSNITKPENIFLYKEQLSSTKQCNGDQACIQSANEQFIQRLKQQYSGISFSELFSYCNNACKTARQIEYIAAAEHQDYIKKQEEIDKNSALNKHKFMMTRLERNYQIEYQEAKIRQQRALMAFAAGMQAYSQSMQQNANNGYYNQPAYNNYSYGYQPYRLPTYQNSFSPSYTTRNRIGNFTYYNSNNGMFGNSQRLGNFTYYHFNSGLSGNSQRLGNFTYYHFNNGLNGTSQRIGNFTYHNFNSGLSGTSQRIGKFTYDHFSDGTNCTTQYIGSYAYTNCY